MSLYESISKGLASKGLSTAIGNASDSLLGGVSDTISGVFGNSTFGKAVANIGTSMARNAAVGVVNKYIPASMQRMVNAGTGALGDVLNGDFSNAGLRVLDSGILADIIPGMDGVGTQARFFGTPTPLFGGISPAEAQQIYQDMRSTNYCRKNLFLIEVSSRLGSFDRFNLFVTDVDYAPLTITGEKRKIGAGHIDTVNSADPVEMRMTTYDDDAGMLKNWFRTHAEACASQDGTVGVPDRYAINIKIVHGFITQGSNRGGYEDVGLFRTGNIDAGLSRKEDGLQELQMSFVQLDTFMRP